MSAANPENTVSDGIDVQITADSVIFSVYVQPRASAVAFVGTHEKSLKIKLTAPPAEGAANKQCCQLLAKALSIPKTAVEILGGHTSRHKRIRIHIAPGSPQKIQSLADRVRVLAE